MLGTVLQIGGLIGEHRFFVQVVEPRGGRRLAELLGQPLGSDPSDDVYDVVALGDGENRTVGERTAVEIQDATLSVLSGD